MAEMIGEMVDNLIEHGTIRELIPLPGDVFNRLMERLRRRRFEAQGFKYDNREAATPEG